MAIFNGYVKLPEGTPRQLKQYSVLGPNMVAPEKMDGDVIHGSRK